jgi:haloalkane dehalogenase
MHYPAWLDRSEYPFAAHTLEVDGGRMHYVDEGNGPTVVMVHGTPTWSFLYRHLIKYLSQDYRCIAMDHLGFGLSDKPTTWSYRVADHAHNLATLIDCLDLKDLTLVVHDFGGAIGLDYALNHPENVKGLVLFNTWMWPFDDPAAIRVSKLMHGPIGKLLYTRLNFSPRVIVKAAWGDKRTLTAALHRHYTAVHATPQERYGMWVLAREVLDAGRWWQSQWERRARIAGIPALLLWGMRDPAIKPVNRARWQSCLTDVRMVTFPTAGHFVQEEQPAASSAAVREFLTGQIENQHLARSAQSALTPNAER